MTRKLKSGEEITSIGIKRKTLAIFQVLSLSTGLSMTELLREIGEAFDPSLAHYYGLVFEEKKKLNFDVKRVGNMIQISLIPKLEVKSRNEGESYNV